MIDYSEQSGLLFHKGTLRVLLRIDKKKALAKAERVCRAAVKARDQGRCRVPACRQASTHLHHITYRSHGGKWHSANVVALCVLHHQLVHGGVLHISGDADKTLTFEGRVKL